MQAEEDEQFLKTLSDIQTKVFERNATYNNALLAAGYAGAFTVWSFTKGQLPDKASIFVALALVVSLTTFITFEVVKMIVVGRYVSKQIKVANRTGDPTEKRAAILAMEKAHGKVLVGFMGFWAFSLAISVAGALIAVGLLLYNFVAVLLKWPGWPA
ncbi:hypothetical protein [Methylobacterium sp. SD21]|uniref:hypothetical protein n=1 Tax=Methylobacterium litchii TaxID=3138810 RepID=UPI00313BEE79